MVSMVGNVLIMKFLVGQYKVPYMMANIIAKYGMTVPAHSL